MFTFPHRGAKDRMDPCDLCANARGFLVGQVNYFGLINADMIQCPDCGLISIDPIPSKDIVKEGCTRLYRHQQPNETRESILRGFAKSYRRGALFAREHLEGKPLRILEVGAGDGYFSAGIKATIPESQIWLMDVVEDLMSFYSAHHDCTPVLGEFPSSGLRPQSFDLIIFRDLLEHTRYPFQFLSNTASLLAPGGKIFFITPNGREDFWMINQRFLKTGKPAVMLLNHFHYFLPETLDRMLEKTAFAKITAYKFGMKHHRRGLGVKEFTSFPEETIPAVRELPKSLSGYWEHDPREIRARRLSDLGVLSRAYSHVVDRDRPDQSFASPIGHEFFIIAQHETF